MSPFFMTFRAISFQNYDVMFYNKSIIMCVCPNLAFMSYYFFQAKYSVCQVPRELFTNFLVHDVPN